MAHEAETPAYCILFITMWFGSVVFLDVKKSSKTNLVSQGGLCIQMTELFLCPEGGRPQQMAIRATPHSQEKL